MKTIVQTNEDFVVKRDSTEVNIFDLESASNKVTSLSNSSTDNQYPSAKVVYDSIQAVSATPDWNAKQGEAGYIQNRTHYTTPATGTFINNPTISYSGDMTDYPQSVDFWITDTNYHFTYEGIYQYNGTDEGWYYKLYNLVTSNNTTKTFYLYIFDGISELDITQITRQVQVFVRGVDQAFVPGGQSYEPKDVSTLSGVINVNLPTLCTPGSVPEQVTKLDSKYLPTISYNDLSNKPTITVPNDGMLTIAVNHDPLGYFTANSDDIVEIDIPVPTKVSDLTNDSKFITEDEEEVIAASLNDLNSRTIANTTAIKTAGLKQIVDIEDTITSSNHHLVLEWDKVYIYPGTLDRYLYIDKADDPDDGCYHEIIMFVKTDPVDTSTWLGNLADANTLYIDQTIDSLPLNKNYKIIVDNLNKITVHELIQGGLEQ